MASLNRVLHAAFFTPIFRNGAPAWGLPVHFTGLPGGSKTARHVQFARLVGVPFLAIAPLTAGEGAFGAVPYIKIVNGIETVVYPLPDWFEMFGAGAGLLLVDEMTTATGGLAAPVMKLAQEGEIGMGRLSGDVRIFTASNPPECSANGQQLTAPSANRFCHINFDAFNSPKATLSYWRGKVQRGTPQAEPEAASCAPFDIKGEEDRVLAQWPTAMAHAVELIGGFICRRPDLFHSMPAADSVEQGAGWTSPRAWEGAQWALATASVHNLTEDERDILGAGFVGQIAWGALCDYLVAMDLPDPVALLDSKIAWAPDRRRLDTTAIVIMACMGVITAKTCENKPARGAAMWRLLDQANAVGARDLTIEPMAKLAAIPGMIFGPVAMRALTEGRTSGMQAAMTVSK